MYLDYLSTIQILYLFSVHVFMYLWPQIVYLCYKHIIQLYILMTSVISVFQHTKRKAMPDQWFRNSL